MKEKLKSILLFDGLATKEDYESVVGELREQNRVNLFVYNIVLSIIFFGLFLVARYIEDISTNEIAYIATMIFTIIIAVVSGTIAKKNHIINTIATYMFITLIAIYTIVIGTINEPSEPSVGFNVFLALIPFWAYDIALRSLLYRVVICAIYFVFVFKFKDSGVILTDVVDALAYGTAATIVGLFNQRIKTRAYYLANNMEKEVASKTAAIEELMVRQQKQSEEMTLLLIKTLSDTIEAKDEYTRGHSNRVSVYSALIADKLGLPKEEASRIEYAATLHDIGKIGVPDTVLNKPSRLTDEEYGIIKKHSTIGADILKNINIISYTSDIARHHHERYDGKGYPDGLKGDEISIGSRIVAVADSFDAMNSERIYRKPLAREIITNEITKNKGVQFDPEVADVFLELLESGVIDEIDSENKDTDSDAIIHDDAGKILSAVVNTMKSGSAIASNDFLTGLLPRGVGEERIATMMKEKKGALVFCDMDNLKPINDRIGHKAGDRALKLVGSTIASYSENGIACRIGGDEFLLYLDDVNEDRLIETIEAIIEDFNNAVCNDAEINMASLSIGACLTSPTDVYANVLSKADKALYHVKQQGKAGYYIYREDIDSTIPDTAVDINNITKSIEKAGRYKGALDTEYRQFVQLYEYLHKICERYDHSCNVVLVTLDSKSNKTIDINSIEQGMHYMEMAIKNTIRTVDVCTRYSAVQFLIVLVEVGEENVDTVMNRIFTTYYKMSDGSELIPKYEASTVFEKNKSEF